MASKKFKTSSYCIVGRQYSRRGKKVSQPEMVKVFHVQGCNNCNGKLSGPSNDSKLKVDGLRHLARNIGKFLAQVRKKTNHGLSLETWAKTGNEEKTKNPRAASRTIPDVTSDKLYRGKYR